MPLDLLAVGKRAARAVEIIDDILAAFNQELAMHSRDVWIDEMDVVRPATSAQERLVAERKHSSFIRPGQDAELAEHIKASPSVR